MEPQVYQEIAQQEDSHWWFCALRAIARVLLKRLQLPHHANILDAGCGSGGNLSLLTSFGKVYAFEMDKGSVARAKTRGVGQIESGSLPDAIPFDGMTFDLITLFDVLEHIKDDNAALAALAARLKPGGALLINVPAFPCLFSRHDELNHHYRRYNMNELAVKVNAAGFDIRVMNYWNFWLFPAVAAARLMERLRPPHRDSLGLNTRSATLNRLLAWFVSSERFLVPRLWLPFGTSIILLAEKRR